MGSTNSGGLNLRTLGNLSSGLAGAVARVTYVDWLVVIDVAVTSVLVVVASRFGCSCSSTQAPRGDP